MARNAEHARQRIVSEHISVIHSSLEIIEEAMRSQWFKVCPKCGHADLATDLHAFYCMACGTPLKHESLAYNPADAVDCDETCARLRCEVERQVASTTEQPS